MNKGVLVAAVGAVAASFAIYSYIRIDSPKKMKRAHLSEYDVDSFLHLTSPAFEDEIRALAMSIFPEWKRLKDIKLSKLSGGITNSRKSKCSVFFF